MGFRRPAAPTADGTLTLPARNDTLTLPAGRRPQATRMSRPRVFRSPPSLALALLLGAARAFAASGGPDAAGYTWADSDEPGLDLGYPPFAASDLRPLGFTGD